MKRYAVLLVMLIAASHAASIRTPALAKPATLAHPPTGMPTVSWPLNGGSDTEIVATPVTFQQGQGYTYYVAPNGDDSNPGTEAQPFRTLDKGISVLDSGDTLYIREGTYYEEVTVSSSGTAGKQITISAYPEEHPIIDAQGTLPGDYYGYLITLRGDYITLSGLEIKNVYGTAVWVRGSHNIVRNMKIHHCLNKAILVGGGGDCSSGVSNAYDIVEDNEVWMTSLIHEGINYGGRWAGAISVARCPQHTIVRRNVVHETWGIGIQAYEAYNTTFEDNVVWNNQLEHYYVNNAPYTLVQRNLAYNTPDSIFLYMGRPGVGIAFCDENPEPLSHHVTIVNNLVLGGGRGFYFFNQQAESGLKDFLMAHNTFVDSHTVGLTIEAGDHENSRIYNNVFLEEGTVAIVPDDPDLDFSHNLWTEAPSAAASNAYDVIGDPRLVMSGSTDPGLLDADWFSLLSDSPAVDAGITLSEVPSDFDGAPRPTGPGYDIGAYEFPSVRVTDLRVVSTVGGVPSLTATLRWTAPDTAVTYTLRSSDTPLTTANWSSAPLVTVPFTASEPGSSEWLTTPVDYTGGTLYLALKCQNAEGIWSALSNNAFWPHFDVYLPLMVKDYVSSSHTSYLRHCLQKLGQSQGGYTIMIKRYLYIGIGVIIVMSVVFTAFFGRRAWNWLRGRFARPLPVSTEPIESDGTYTNLIFLHHSTGHNLIAQGDVRTLLTEKGYQFWDHDYNTTGLTRPDGILTQTSYDIPEITPGTRGGGNTDPEGLAILFAQPVHSPPDNAFSRLLQHEVLIFKSCFPNSAIKSDEMLEQHKTWYLGMRDVIDQHPDRMFVFLTTPPLHPAKTTPEEAARARALANWLRSDEFLAGRSNLFVFDFFDLLVDPETNTLRSEYQRDPNSTDSHPNVLANQTIGPLFVDCVDEAIQAYRADH